MEDLIVNNVKVEEQFNDDLTVNKLLDHILNQQYNDDDLITEVKLDGVAIPEEKELQLLDSHIGNYQSVECTILSRLDLAFDALNSCSKHIDIINQNISVVVAAYQEGREHEANSNFAQTIELIDLFIQLIARCQETIKKNFQEEDETYKKIQNLEIHLLSILKSLIPAKEKQDFIMLCDLLEYELADNLTQWKISVIPELKRLRQT
jgi:hypothetical protein